MREYTNFVLRDCTFQTHMQDVLDIMHHLQTPLHRKELDFSRLAFFTHRRAFRKLGYLVQLVFEHCGNTSPFAIMEGCTEAFLDNSSNWNRRFTLNLDKYVLRMVTRFVYPEDDAIDGEGNIQYVFWMDASNIESWILLFKHWWDKLYTSLLVSDTEPIPNETATKSITLFICCIYSLRDVWTHLFSVSVPQFTRSLAQAGTHQFYFLFECYTK